MTDDTPFRRLLRWYPRRWRHDNGAVFLGTILDRAEHEGRTEPTAAERASAAVHGSAAHLTTRLALVVATTAAVFAAISGATMVWGPSSTLPIVHLAVNVAAIPLLLAVALVSVVRVRGWASDASALAFVPLSGVSIVFGALAQAGWSQAFDAADAGRDAAGLGAAVGPLALAGIASGALAIAVLAGSALRRALPGRLPRLLVCAALGLVGAIAVAWVLFVPFGAAVSSVGVVWLATKLPSPSTRTLSHTAPALPARAAHEPRPVLGAGMRRLAFALDAAALLIGALGVIVMATNLRLPPAGIAIHGDQIARGIVILLLSVLPLLAALGIRVAARTRHSTRHPWGPLALAALSIVGGVVAYRYSPDPAGMTPWLQASAIAGGAALAWWIIPRHGAALGIAAGVVWAAPLGVLLVPVLAFVAPVCAVIALAWHGRRRRAKAHEVTPPRST